MNNLPVISDIDRMGLSIKEFGVKYKVASTANAILEKVDEEINTLDLKDEDDFAKFEKLSKIATNIIKSVNNTPQVAVQVNSSLAQPVVSGGNPATFANAVRELKEGK